MKGWIHRAAYIKGWTDRETYMKGWVTLKISTYIMYASPSVPLFFLGFGGFLLYFFSLKQT